MSGCVAVVVGAGRGRRFGSGMPKQYCMLGGEPMVRRTLLAFLGHPGVDAVRPVINPDDTGLFEEAVRGLDLLQAVDGGDTRQESVRQGLESLADLAPDRVLIHDAARPFVGEDLISRVLEALESGPGAIPALPVGDTLKRGDNGLITGTVERQGLWRAQTPQGFRYREILDAHRRYADAGLTDDAAVAERAGLAVGIVSGSEENLKVTTQDDLRRAERHFIDHRTHTGIGFDVHRFGPGDRVVLCGIPIPFTAGLVGHSDADVGLHALTDALLGAIGSGDIGSHFPPDDPEWRDASSDIFLRRAGEMVAARGGRIANLDVTVICEAPRVAPHRAAMTRRIAEILDLPESCVSVKATTTEGLGYTGRGEGIAAQAVATVDLPSGLRSGIISASE